MSQISNWKELKKKIKDKYDFDCKEQLEEL